MLDFFSIFLLMIYLELIIDLMKEGHQIYGLAYCFDPEDFLHNPMEFKDLINTLLLLLLR